MTELTVLGWLYNGLRVLRLIMAANSHESGGSMDYDLNVKDYEARPAAPRAAIDEGDAGDSATDLMARWLRATQKGLLLTNNPTDVPLICSSHEI